MAALNAVGPPLNGPAAMSITVALKRRAAQEVLRTRQRLRIREQDLAETERVLDQVLIRMRRIFTWILRHLSPSQIWEASREVFSTGLLHGVSGEARLLVQTQWGAAEEEHEDDQRRAAVQQGFFN